MEISKTKLAAASFGAAMTSLYSAPELSAQLVDIAFSPASVPFVNLNAEENYPGFPVGFAADGLSANLNVVVYNNLNSFGDPVAFAFNGFSNARSLNTTGGLLEPGDVVDGSGSIGSNDFVEFSVSSTGVRYFGFLTGGNIGWFSVDLGATPGQPGNTVTFIDGQVLQNSAAGDEVVVGRPSTVLRGDVNLDESVTFADISPFIAVLSANGFQAEADVNDDGVVNFADISPFISILSSASSVQVSWSDSSGKPLERLAAGNEVLEQQIQAVEQKLTDQVFLASLSPAGDDDSKPASVGLAALALGAAGLRRRRKAVAVA